METIIENKTCRECGRELPITNFKLTRFGTRANVCVECATRKFQKTMQTLKQKKLQDEAERVMLKKKIESELSRFTPRQLMEELARRGYKGVLEYTRVEKIDITDF